LSAELSDLLKFLHHCPPYCRHLAATHKYT